MRRRKNDVGFTTVELMVVVLIIGVLVAIAIPVFNGAKARSLQKTCFSNQRTVETTAQSWSSVHDSELASLEGPVVAGHPLVGQYIFRVPPRCPAAPEPDDAMNATVVTGAYTLDDDGNVSPCTFGDPVHGKFR